MTMIWSVRVFMLSNRFDRPGDLYAAIPQRESSAIDAYELELVVFIIVRDGETGPDLEALAAHDEAGRSVEMSHRPGRRQLGSEDFEDLPVTEGRGRSRLHGRGLFRGRPGSIGSLGLVEPSWIEWRVQVLRYRWRRSQSREALRDGNGRLP